MNRKGFTLVEILAVVGILAILGIIVIPKITKLKNENIIKLYKEQEDRLKEKAGEYLNDNYTSENIDSFVITKDQLIEGGYISELYDLKEKANECEAFVYISSNTTTPKVTPYLSCSGYTTENYSTYSNLTEYSVTNLITNGSFEEDLSNWSWYKTTNVGSLKTINSYIGAKSLYINTNSSVEMAIRPSVGISFSADHKYYSSINGYFSSVNLPSLSVISYLGGLSSYSMNLTVLNKWQKGSSLFTVSTSSTITDIRFGHVYANAASYNAYFDGILLVDLTATFGAGNEPTQAWCDTNLDYFDGTKILNLPI